MRKSFDLRNKAYVKIIDTKGSSRLYLYVKYPGISPPHEESSGMLDTPENWEDLQSEVDDMNADIRREKQITKWRRDWKLRLIEEANPERCDLAEDL